MWKIGSPGYKEEIDANLVLRTPVREEDVNRLAEFNASVHGPEIDPMTRRLLLSYPYIEPQDQVFVETNDGRIVSALTLIPWTWNYEGTLLPVSEMGIVGTAEPYRGRGLIRAQVAYFKKRLRQRGCLLSSIQGIPNFYRQFGYEYALPLEGGYRLELRLIPETPATGFRLREASIADIPLLIPMYASAVQLLSIHTERSKPIWRHLMTVDDPSDAMYRETWIVESDSGSPQGYFRVPRFHFGDELVIDEAWAAGYDSAVAILRHAARLASERNRPGVRLNLPASSHLVSVFLAHGAFTMGTYAWQIHIPDIPALLLTIRSVLENRLAGSMFSGWTGTVCLSFYTCAVSMVFERGCIRQIEATAPSGNSEVRIPHSAFGPLVLGYRSIDDLHEQFPDVDVRGKWKLMIDILFPKYESFIFPTY